MLQTYSLAEFVPAWRGATVWRLLVRTGADLQMFKACVMPVAGALHYSKLVKSVQEVLLASGLADMQRRQLRPRQRRAQRWNRRLLGPIAEDTDFDEP